MNSAFRMKKGFLRNCGSDGTGCGRIKKEIKVPFGVNIVSNPLATIDLAAAVEADMG